MNSFFEKCGKPHNGIAHSLNTQSQNGHYWCQGPHDVVPEALSTIGVYFEQWPLSHSFVRLKARSFLQLRHPGYHDACHPRITGIVECSDHIGV